MGCEKVRSAPDQEHTGSRSAMTDEFLMHSAENGWLKALLINGAPQPFSSPSASSEEGKVEATSGLAQSVE